MTRAKLEELWPCPCCDARELSTLGVYEICGVCGWEDDPVQARDVHYEGGANQVSLQQARERWTKNNKKAPSAGSL